MKMPTSIPWSADVEIPSACEHDLIAHRAQEIWRDLGCPEHRDLDIWLEAEAEVRATLQKVFRHPHLPLAT